MYIILNILEAIYILYMYNYFKTTYSIHFRWETNITKYNHFFKHPIKTGKYESKICKLGNIVGYLFFFWILLRVYYKNSVKPINTILFLLLITGSLIMNLNAFVYLLPVFIFEYYLYKHI